MEVLIAQEQEQEPKLAPTPSPRGRKASAVAELAALPAETEQAAAAMVEDLRGKMVTLSREQLAQSFELGQMVGAARQAQFIETTSRVSLLTTLQRVKESKLYKDLDIPLSNGEWVHVTTWEDMCKAIGFSRVKIDEDLKNLALFGSSLIEAQEALGLGYRDLRKLKAGLNTLSLEEQQKALETIQEASASGDKEEMQAAIADLVVLNRKQEKIIKDTESDLDAARKLLTKKSDQVTKLDIELEKFKNPGTPEEKQQAINAARGHACQNVDIMASRVQQSGMALCSSVIHLLSQCDKDTGENDILNADTMNYINGRVSLMCQNLRASLLEAGIDVDFATEFDPYAPLPFGQEEQLAPEMQSEAEEV